MTHVKQPLHCSFCGKSQHDVRKLIAGPTVFICDECIELCMDIVNEEAAILKAKELLKTNGYIIVDPAPENKKAEAEKLLREQGYTITPPPPPASSLEKFQSFMRS